MSGGRAQTVPAGRYPVIREMRKCAEMQPKLHLKLPPVPEFRIITSVLGRDLMLESKTLTPSVRDRA